MRQRPSVLFLIGSLREGGAEGQLLHLMRGLRARGWRVGLMLLHGEGVRLEEALKEGFEVFDVGLPRFRPRWSPLPVARLAGTWWRSRRFLRQWKPDVVHSWLFWAHVWAWLLLPAGRRPAFVMGRRQTWSDSNRSPWLRAMQRAINRRSQATVANSRAVRISVRRREGSSAEPCLLVYNGLDMRSFEAAPRNLRRDFPPLRNAELIVVTVANLLPHKGYDLLLEAWRPVAMQFPGARLLCVGSDSAGMRQELEARLRTEKVEQSVIFAGTQRDIPGLLLGADLAVHASRDEGLSNALLEYQAAGLPIVATDVGGNREALGNGRAGLVVPPGDARALAEGLRTLLLDEKKRAHFGRQGTDNVRRRFGMDRMISRYERLYARLSGR